MGQSFEVDEMAGLSKWRIEDLKNNQVKASKT
jgi:hypothetical protein